MGLCFAPLPCTATGPVLAQSTTGPVLVQSMTVTHASPTSALCAGVRGAPSRRARAHKVHDQRPTASRGRAAARSGAVADAQMPTLRSSLPRLHRLLRASVPLLRLSLLRLLPRRQWRGCARRQGEPCTSDGLRVSRELGGRVRHSEERVDDDMCLAWAFGHP